MKYKIAASPKIKEIFQFLRKPELGSVYDVCLVHEEDAAIDMGWENPWFTATMYHVPSLGEVIQFLDHVCKEIPNEINFTRADVSESLRKYRDVRPHSVCVSRLLDEFERLSHSR